MLAVLRVLHNIRGGIIVHHENIICKFFMINDTVFRTLWYIIVMSDFYCGGWKLEIRFGPHYWSDLVDALLLNNNNTYNWLVFKTGDGNYYVQMHRET